MSRKIPPEEYTKYGKFIEDEEQYDCRTIDRVLDIIDTAQPYVDGRVDVAAELINRMLDRQAVRDAVLALKGGEQE